MFRLVKKPAAVTPPPAEQGFTMLEVLITMLILTIVLVGLAALQVATIRQVTLARNANGALRLGQSVIEKYRRMAFINLPGTTSPDWEQVPQKDPAYYMDNVFEDGQWRGSKGAWRYGPYTVNVFAEVTGNADRLITVRVTWLDLMPGTNPDPTKTYRTLESMLTLRRSEL